MAITAPATPIADAPGPRMSRAAMLAGAALMIGCQAHKPDATVQVYGGPPPPAAEGPEAGALDSTADAAPTPWVDSEAPDAGPKRRDAGTVPSTIYGAPPPGHRH